MLIRSQDKKLLINLDNMESISICGYRVNNKSVYEDDENVNTWYITCTSQDYSPFVGHYSTESKAIKVLDMMQEQYARFSCRYGGDHSEDAVFQIPSEITIK